MAARGMLVAMSLEPADEFAFLENKWGFCWVAFWSNRMTTDHKSCAFKGRWPCYGALLCCIATYVCNQVTGVCCSYLKLVPVFPFMCNMISDFCAAVIR